MKDKLNINHIKKNTIFKDGVFIYFCAEFEDFFYFYCDNLAE
jgi:hypothetical protein